MTTHDSQTVLKAIQIDIYRYQTFLTNRVEEIQKSATADDWLCIQGDFNVADINEMQFQRTSERIVLQNGP